MKFEDTRTIFIIWAYLWHTTHVRCGIATYSDNFKYFNLNHECPTVFGKGPQPLLWVGSRAAYVRIIISGMSNLLNDCVLFENLCIV
jgi:hypothetical protein